VAQVAAAVCADDLGALHAEGAVAAAQDRPGHGVEEGRPAAAAAELVRGAVQRRVAARARVGALLGEVLVERAGVWGFGALLAEDAELFCERGLAVGLAGVGAAGICTRGEGGPPFLVGLLHGERHGGGTAAGR
jgi:hypothetical protein